MRYDSALMDADFPYLLDTGAGEIAELPPHSSLDDDRVHLADDVEHRTLTPVHVDEALYPTL